MLLYRHFVPISVGSTVVLCVHALSMQLYLLWSQKEIKYLSNRQLFDYIRLLYNT